MNTRWARVKDLNEMAFRRLTGVKKFTFEVMVRVVREALSHKRGRPHQLGVEDRILLTLEYLREYRTSISLGKSEGYLRQQLGR